MVLLTANQNDKDVNFNGIKHRLFIEGRGFDFRFFNISSDGSAELELAGPEDPLYTFLDFEEPRVIYVVSRLGNKELILQGCVIKEINGDKCSLVYSKLQLD